MSNAWPVARPMSDPIGVWPMRCSPTNCGLPRALDGLRIGMITDAASWVLATLKRSLGARTVALLWLDDDGERVKLKEVASDADDITETPRLPSALLGCSPAWRRELARTIAAAADEMNGGVGHA